MADSTTALPSNISPMDANGPAAEPELGPQPRPRPRGPPLSQVYALPAPIRTFPLPSFYPNNPISLLHLAYAWMRQVLSPPPAEPSAIHTGVWDPDSRSVHVTDPVAVRALWEQGFYGKGNLSRSEPNWLKREQIRRGTAGGDVSEQRTAVRREERRQLKWERARTEQEALERIRREEAQSTASTAVASPSPAEQAELRLELSASKSQPRSASNKATLSLGSSVSSATAATSLHASVTSIQEATIQETVAVPTDTGKEPGDPPNGVAKGSSPHGPPPTHLDTHTLSPTDHGIQYPSFEASPAVMIAPVLSKAPLLAKAPVGPLELLSLPNSVYELQLTPDAATVPESTVLDQSTAGRDVVEAKLCNASTVTTAVHGRPLDKPSHWRAPVGPMELLALPNSLAAVMLAGPTKPSALCGVTVNGTSHMTNLEKSDNVPAKSAMSKSPVGPLELLALPNSISALRSDTNSASLDKDLLIDGARDVVEPHQGPDIGGGVSSIVSALQTTGEDGADASPRAEDKAAYINDHANGPIFGSINTGPAMSDTPGSKHTLATPDAAEEQPPKRRRKSVRFSATVESTTFLHCDPPSPDRSVNVAKCNGTANVEAISAPIEPVLTPVEASARAEKRKDKPSVSQSSPETASSLSAESDIENKEHLQLSAEEAFFLAYGIGALSILDPDTNVPLPRERLLALFRSHSYFPPRQELQPGDPFLVHYVVYHHFRSLGWVPRHGIKFGVDWMLYTRGPVFDHAEFGLIVMPSYSHSWWRENGVEAPRKSWHWLHGVNRVLSHVLKSLVLVYVDVPPPHVFDAAMAAGGISAALKEYRVREFMVRRWSSNRNR